MKLNDLDKTIENNNTKDQILDDIDTNPKLEKKFNIQRNLAQAYCSVAEHFIHGSQLDSNVNDIQEALKKAINTDAKYLEPYYQYAFFYFNLALEKECRDTIQVLVNKLKAYESEEDQELHEYNEEFLLPIVRMMVEGAIWEDAIYLCD